MHLFGLGNGAVWLWLVLMPVSGWLVLQSRFFRHRMWDLSGYNRYFLIMLVGITNASIGIALIVASGYWISGWELERLPGTILGSSALAEIWKSPVNYETAQTAAQSPASVRLALFWSVPAGFVFGLLVHALAWFVPKKMVGERRTEYLTKVNGMLNFVAEADKRTSLVMLTLNNRKVYIGWPRGVSDWNNPSPSKQYLHLVPVHSGFRKQDSLELEITTNYDEAYHKKYSGITADFNAEISAWEIVLPVSEIIHAQPFDPDFYRVIRRRNPKTKPASKRKPPPKPRPARRK